jgi:hypothetical protein
MRKGILPVVAFLMAGLLTAREAIAQAPTPDAADDKAAIEQTVRDYIDGWYEGNAERMARALHPDLAKRAFATLSDGSMVLQIVTADAMVTFTKAGFGKKKARPGQKNEVTILDVSETIATAKSVSPDFIDYIHLAKVDGRWRIVNVLWRPVPQKEPAK